MEEDQGIDLGVKKVPASEAIQGTGTQIPKQIYPLVEEMTFRAIIKSKDEGYALLRAIQILVNELGGATIVQLCDKLEKNPKLIEQARSYLPYILKL